MKDYKICHICSNFDNFFLDFMEEQINANIDFRVFYFRAIERGMPEVNEKYLDIRLNFNNWMRYIFFLKEHFVYKDFCDLYKNSSFDLLHAHTVFTNGYIAYKNKQKTGTPYIVAVRDTDLNVFFKYRIYLRNLGIEILKNSEKIVFISDNYRQSLLDLYVSDDNDKKIINEKSIVIPNGINDFFHKNMYNSQNSNYSKKFTVITVGHVMKRKNQLSVCKAIEMLIKDGYDIRYLVVGKVLDQEYFNKVNDYSFVEYRDFTKDKNELIEYYRESDIFVMPSLTETFGLTYVEAMSQGLPIIYSTGQGIEYYLSKKHVGESVSATDNKEIALAIEKIILEIDDYRNNLKLSTRIFDWKIITKDYINIYNEVIKNS